MADDMSWPFGGRAQEGGYKKEAPEDGALRACGAVASPIKLRFHSHANALPGRLCFGQSNAAI